MPASRVSVLQRVVWTGWMASLPVVSAVALSGAGEAPALVVVLALLSPLPAAALTALGGVLLGPLERVPPLRLVPAGPTRWAAADTVLVGGAIALAAVAGAPFLPLHEAVVWCGYLLLPALLWP